MESLGTSERRAGIARERHGQDSLWSVLHRRSLSPRRAQMARGPSAGRLSELALPLSQHRQGHPGLCHPGAAEHKPLVSDLSSALGAPCDRTWSWQLSPPDPFGRHSPLTPSCPTALHHQQTPPDPDPGLEKPGTRAGTTGTRAHAPSPCQALGWAQSTHHRIRSSHNPVRQRFVTPLYS